MRGALTSRIGHLPQTFEGSPNLEGDEPMLRYYGLIAGLFWIAISCEVAAQPLVTAEEASRPNEDIRRLDLRSISPGPTIRMASPSSKDVGLRVIAADDVH